MRMLREQSLGSLTETKDARHLIGVFVYAGREWVAYCYGIITGLSDDALVFCSRGDGQEIRLNLRDNVLDTNVPGFEIYKKKWRLRGSDGLSWNIFDCESADSFFF